jgi:hypothetical protein
MAQAHRDRHCNTNKQQIRAEIGMSHAGLRSKRMIQTIRDSGTEPKGHNHARSRDARRYPPVTDEKTQVGLEADDEQKKHETQVGDKIQVGNRCSREDGICESGDPSHYRWTQDDAGNDLCDDPRLPELGQGPVNQAT